MEKVFEFNCTKKMSDLLKKRVKTKSQIIEILIEVATIVLPDYHSKKEEYGKFIINTDGSKRIFFSVDYPEKNSKKHFSFNFPFNIIKVEDSYKLTTLYGAISIKNHHLAVLRSLCSKGGFDEKEGRHGILLDFVQLTEATFNDLGMRMESFEQDFNQILLELFTFETSYIRFDYDERNEKGTIHPLNHLDIFYTQNTTFKLGCNSLELTEFMNILNTKTECSFIN